MIDFSRSRNDKGLDSRIRGNDNYAWIPAFAGMTMKRNPNFVLAVYT